LLELSPFAGNLVRTYSGGMRRKLDLAMSLMGRPRVLFLDEPTTGLDPRSRNALWEIVRDLAGDGTTILLTTQYLEEADRLADRISVIDHGRVVAEGTPRELKSQLAGEILTLTFPDVATAKAAMAILQGESVQSGDLPATLTVATDGTTGHVYAVLERLQRAGTRADRLAITAPSLDDVFLSLTQVPDITHMENVA
jgi:ABC-2 type transport system ATP-binding protein